MSRSSSSGRTTSSSQRHGRDSTAGDEKVAGILAEATSDGAIVVGAGVNVAWAPAPLSALGHRRRLASTLWPADLSSGASCW